MLAQGQLKNVFGLSIGITPGIADLYLGNPLDIWPSHNTGPVYHIFYSVQITETFRIGPYYEYEQARYSESGSEGVYGFDRYSPGINWLGQVPRSALHVEFGGYLGYGLLKARNWDRLKGFEYGLMAGPALDLKRFGAAIHIETGHGRYKSSGSPSSVLLFNPKILLKVYYKFNWSDILGKG